MSSMKNQITEVIKEELNESQISHTGRNTPLEESFKGKNKEEFLNKSGNVFIDVLEVEDEQIFNDSFMQERADIQIEREHENEIKDQLKSLIIRNQKKTDERNGNRCSYNSFFKSEGQDNQQSSRERQEMQKKQSEKVEQKKSTTQLKSITEQIEGISNILINLNEFCINQSQGPSALSVMSQSMKTANDTHATTGQFSLNDRESKLVKITEG